MRLHRTAMSTILLLTASLTLSAPAWSQDVFEEIVVTAAKRAQTLQEVPVAVTVVGADVMQKAQIVDIKDLQSLVPSLRVSQLQVAGNTSFFIRGFGNGSNNIGTEPSVGVFIDGVYRSRSASALSDFPNLERIEVLRGPQSTLFGKNASAGVISVVTAKPDLDAFGGSASVTVGDLSQFIVKGDITGPITDNFAFSLAANSNTRDGYFTNLNTGGEFNELNRWGVRGQLLLQPSDSLELRLIADLDEIDEVCCGVANILNGPSSGIIGLIGGQVFTEMPFERAQYYNYDARNEIDNSGVSLQVDYDFENVTLTSITALRNQERLEDADSDFTSADILAGAMNTSETDTFSQEIRLASSGGESFDWMVGGYYFDEDLDINNALTYGQDFRAFADILTGTFPFTGPSGIDLTEASFGFQPGSFQAPGDGTIEVMSQKNTAFSIFGQVDLHLSDQLTLTLGANYTEDEKDVAINFPQTPLFSSLDFVQIVYAGTFEFLTMGLPPTPANIAANPVADQTAIAIATTNCDAMTMPPFCNQLLPLQPFQFLPPFLAFPNAVESGNTNDDDTSWSVRLAFDATENVNIYVSAATGFKASSWNLTRDSRPFASDLAALGAGPNDRFGPPNLVSGTRFAGPEEARAFEIGYKGRFDNFTINLAVFDQTIEGFQSAIFIGTGFVLANAGEQSTTGIELETNWAPTDALSFSFSGALMDPKYDSFLGAQGAGGVPTDLSGEHVAGVSRFSMNLSGLYTFDFGDSGEAFIRGDYVYDDKVQLVENIPADIASREISSFNASFGIAWDNGFEATLWGRNITDDEYITSAFPTTIQSDRISAYPNQPRTYGLTVTKHFD